MKKTVMIHMKFCVEGKLCSKFYNAQDVSDNKKNDFFMVALERLSELYPEIPSVLEVSKSTYENLKLPKIDFYEFGINSNCGVNKNLEILLTDENVIYSYGLNPGCTISEFEGDSINIPINLYDDCIGVIKLYQTQAAVVTTITKVAEVLVQKTISTIQTYHARSLVENKFGSYWYGESDFIQRIIKNCRLYSKLPMPIIIDGEPGAGKRLAAYYIHSYANSSEKPFIEIDCTYLFDSFKDFFLENLQSLNCGSVYIRHAEKLSKNQLNFLLEYIRSAEGLCQNRVRLFISISGLKTNCLPEVEKIAFYSLRVTMPTMRDRWDDLSSMIEALKKEKVICQEFEMSKEVWDLLYDYDWSDNFIQFEVFLKKASFLARDEMIDLEMVGLYFPSIYKTVTTTKTKKDVVGESLSTVINVLEAEVYYHPALIRACEYMRRNFDQPIMMESLAKHSFISPSHLSSLFKKELRKPFKQMLNEHRIYLAKSNLSESPLKQITVIAQEVGYGDFSHFEKTFKRYVGMSPGEYRKKNKKPFSGE